MSSLEYHLVRVSLTVREIHLMVRFPCQLLLQVKSDTEMIEGQTYHNLKEGLCSPNEILTLNVQMTFKQDKYASKKINILLMMISSNSKIIAGSIPVELTADGCLYKSSEELVQKIDKCPDKNAKIAFTMELQKIQTLDKDTYSKMNNLRAKIKTEAREKVSSPKRKTDSSPLRRIKKTQGSQSREYIPLSNKQTRKQLQKSSNPSSEKSSKQSRVLVDSKVSYSHHRVQKINEPNYGNKESDQKRSRLNYEVSNKYEDLIQKKQLNSLALELKNEKAKNKMLEMRERQANAEIKDLKDRLEKEKSKITNQEAKHHDLSLKLQKKQHEYRQLQQELKLQKQSFDELKLTVNTQQKRLNLKEAQYRQQIDRLTQKYHNSEQERQSSTHELNKMLSELESIELRNQQQNKDKDRLYLQEKNKLNKKIQSLSSLNAKLQQENEDLNSSLLQIKTKYSLHNKSSDELRQDFQQNKMKAVQLESVNNKLLATISQKQRQIAELTQLSHDYSTLKKKLAEITNEATRTNDQLTRSKRKIDSLDVKINEYENKIKNYEQLKETLHNKNNQSNQQIANLNKQLEKLNHEINVARRESDELRTQLVENQHLQNQEVLNAKQLNEKLSIEIVYLKKTKDHLEIELDEYRWKVQKDQEVLEMLTKKSNDDRGLIAGLNEEISTMKEKINDLSERVRESESRRQILEKQVIGKGGKEKELMSNIKNKTQVEQNLKRSLKQKEQQVQFANQKLIQLDTKHKEEVYALEQQLQQTDKLLKEATKQIQDLNVLVQNSNNLISQKQAKMNLLKEQINSLKSNIEEDNESIFKLQQQLAEGREISNGLQSTINQLRQRIQQLQKQQIKVKKQLANTDKQFNQYRESVNESLTSFFTELSNLDAAEKSEIVSFPDKAILNLQIQALKKRKQQIMLFEQKIRSLEENEATLNYQIEKMALQSKNREQQFEKQIQRQKQKYKSLSNNSFEQSNDNLKKLMDLEQKNYSLISEIQKFGIQVKNLNQQNEELELTIQHQRVIKGQLQEVLSIMKRQNEDLHSLISQAKMENNSDMNLKLEEKNAQIQRLKLTRKQLQEKCASLQSQINLKQQVIDEQQGKLDEAHLQIGIFSAKIKFQEKIIGENSESKKKIQDSIHSQKQTEQQLQDKIYKLNQQINSLNLKQEQTVYKLQKSTQRIKQLQEEMEAKQQQFDELTLSIIETDLAYKKLKDQSSSKSVSTITQRKQLQERVIELQSQLEMKQFVIKQLESTDLNNKELIRTHELELTDRKDKIKILNSQIEDLSNEILLLKQQNEGLISENNQLTQQCQNRQNLIQSLESDLLNNGDQSETLLQKTKQIQKLTEKVQYTELKLQMTIEQHEQKLRAAKKTQKTDRDSQDSNKVQQLEKQLERSIFQYQQELHRTAEQFEQEKQRLMEEIRTLEQERQSFEQECQFLMQQSTRQIDEMNQEIMQLNNVITEKNEIIHDKDDNLKNNDRKIGLLTQQLKACLEAWENEKRELSAIKNKESRPFGNQVSPYSGEE